MKNLVNYLFIVAIATSLSLMVWAWFESNEIKNHLIEQEKIENILEERRNKIDSLKITQIQIIDEDVQE